MLNLYICTLPTNTVHHTFYRIKCYQDNRPVRKSACLQLQSEQSYRLLANKEFPLVYPQTLSVFDPHRTIPPPVLAPSAVLAIRSLRLPPFLQPRARLLRSQEASSAQQWLTGQPSQQSAGPAPIAQETRGRARLPSSCTLVGLQGVERTRVTQIAGRRKIQRSITGKAKRRFTLEMSSQLATVQTRLLLLDSGTENNDTNDTKCPAQRSRGKDSGSPSNCPLCFHKPVHWRKVDPTNRLEYCGNDSFQGGSPMNSGSNLEIDHG